MSKLLPVLPLITGSLLLLGAALPSSAQEKNSKTDLLSKNLLVASTSSPPSSAPKGSKSCDTDKKASKQFNGNVSWYGTGFNGKKTASGDIFDMRKLMAAHRRLPFGTRVQVEDPKTGDSVIVVVKDRGPFVHTRVMDVSREAGRRLGLLQHGVGYMYCLVLED
jgi:rare lipoprotein A